MCMYACVSYLCQSQFVNRSEAHFLASRLFDALTNCQEFGFDALDVSCGLLDRIVGIISTHTLHTHTHTHTPTHAHTYEYARKYTQHGQQL